MNPSAPIPKNAIEGENNTSSFAIKAPSLSLPKGGGAIKGIGEKFAANPVTGTGSMNIPIATSPGRSGFGPELSLSYDSGSGNGSFGFGWSLSLPSITRKTDKGLPRYVDGKDQEFDSDVFILSGAEDLVPEFVKSEADKWVLDNGEYVIHDNVREVEGKKYNVRRYRPRIEGLFARIERWTNTEDASDVKWRSISKENITTWYGKTENSRIYDPEKKERIFSWLICESYDDKGNAMVYEYEKENSNGIAENQLNELNRDKSRTTNRYLKRIKYGNKESRIIQPDLSQAHWLFETVFDYDDGHYVELPFEDGIPESEQHRYVRATLEGNSNENERIWKARKDAFSSYRAGFEVRTYRLCHRILMFHHFKNELGAEDYLVRSTAFKYDESPVASFIKKVTQSGYCLKGDKYLKKSFPPVEFEYTRAEISSEIKVLDEESCQNLPMGIDGQQYQMVDLDGEGLSGILTEQGDGWYYKPNKGNGQFGTLQAVTTKPSPGSLTGGQQLLDLAGDGQLDLVSFQPPLTGFFERTHDEGWEYFRYFKSIPNIDWNDPNLKFVDLNGDGHADILITEDEVFRWYPSLAEEGFGNAHEVRKQYDENEGPTLVFSDGTQSVYLSDMSGDGLTDLVRIRNGEICYWPNLGYGHFGKKVIMDNSPVFDHPDLFNQQRIRLADIDGSGDTDIIYLKNDGVYVYLNESGNSWKNAEKLKSFPPIDNVSSVMAADLMGNGTACLMWSSPLPGSLNTPLRFVELMGGQKPHLLTKIVNNLGAETHIHYSASTKFYLKDKEEGKPWITKIPFPVHVVEKVETHDRISNNLFVTRYAYHHGYFDGEEREFRGFGMVEQWDTEDYEYNAETAAVNQNPAFNLPPVHTKTWFHTGAYLDGIKISRQFEKEYYIEPQPNPEKLLLPDSILPDNLTISEEKEACRALKGSILRQEIFTDDKSERAAIPYSVSERNYSIKNLQPWGENKHAVFFAHPKETIDYYYERNPIDPQVSHKLTLEVDEYGNAKKAVAVGYGRRNKISIKNDQNNWEEISNPGLNDLLDKDREKQTDIYITYTESDVTNAINNQTDHWRTPVPAEVRTYELRGYQPNNGRFTKNDFITIENHITKLISDEEIPYEQDFTTGKQKRLIECLRTVYRANNLKKLLKKGELETLTLPGESYKLAFTKGLLDSVYKRKNLDGSYENLLPEGNSLITLLEGKGSDQGGYVCLDDDEKWWMPSGRIFYKEDVKLDDLGNTADKELDWAKNHFFLPVKFADPFDQCSLIHYDAYDLFPIGSIDALENKTETKIDYRVLQPWFIKDPNQNCTEASFNSMGMLAGTAILGKISNNGNSESGDSLLGFAPDLTVSQMESFINNPRERDSNQNESRASQVTYDLLNKATSRIIYDLDSYSKHSEHKKPPFAATIAREKHNIDLKNNEKPKLQISFIYSDGFGREIQKKIQAEAGKTLKRDADNHIIVKPDGQPEWNETTACPRWVGSGWTIFNNKGKPVRQFEPFFSDTHQFDDDVKIGVSPVLFYDPVERVIATIHPNHTYEKVVFDAWKQITYEVNDTIASDPRKDADIVGYVEKYFEKEGNWKTWLQQLGVDSQNPPEDTSLLEPEKRAAVRSLIHQDTPSVAYFDSLGRPFLTVDHNKFLRFKDNHLQEHAETYKTRIVLDIEGNQREVVDAKDRIVMKYDYSIAGPEDKDEEATNLIHQISMEAGERWMLNDVSGNPIRMWDSRKFTRRLEYDELRRPKALYVTDNNPERLAEKTVYGEQQGEAGNHRLQVYQVYDAAGVVTNNHYDFKGNLLEVQRELLPDYKNEVNWKTNPVANYDKIYVTSTSYDALNRPVIITFPDKSVYRPDYNEANLPEKIQVNIHGNKPNWTEFISNIDYNAKGQRELIEYGNHTKTRYTYDPFTFRLTLIETTRTPKSNDDLFSDSAKVQDMYYYYDPAGNITQINDRALITTQYNNEDVKPEATYRYDSMYRLIEAHGREHIGQTGFDFNPGDENYGDYPFLGIRAHQNDLKAMRNYTESYVYDVVGNFEKLRHIANGGSWTRHYQYEEQSLIEKDKKSNRLTKTVIGNGTNQQETYTYTDSNGQDANGCMTSMNGKTMTWDFKEQLQKVDLGGGGTAYYVYDASGQRVRKIIESQNGKKHKERLYLGGFEIYREYDSNEEVLLERESLHVMDAQSGEGNQKRIALIETKTISHDIDISKDPLNVPVIRYQYDNHLGSCMLELDETGDWISYEEYHPYGSTSYQAVNNNKKAAMKRYRYSTKERDEETGLYYYGARYYASWLGRWVSCDPAEFVDGMDVYCFIKNNPIKLNDLTGEQSNLSRDAQPVEEHALVLNLNKPNIQQPGIFRVDETTMMVQFYFGQNEFVLNQDNFNELLGLIETLPQLKDRLESVSIYGFASSEGREDYNLKLSELRAQLITAFIKPFLENNSVKSEGKGEIPDSPNSIDKESDRSKNRRVDVILIFRTELFPKETIEGIGGENAELQRSTATNGVFPDFYKFKTFLDCLNGEDCLKEGYSKLYDLSLGKLGVKIDSYIETTPLNKVLKAVGINSVNSKVKDYIYKEFKNKIKDEMRERLN